LSGSHPVSRRDLLRSGAIGGLGLAAVSGLSSAILSACGAAGRGAAAPTSTSTTFGSPVTTAPSDTGASKWWLEGAFAPVREELTADDLPVSGSLPTELSGLYVRNGSNPVQGSSPHWFLGDGMVHGVLLEGGRARWYRNRYVRTALWAHGGGLGASSAPGGAAGLSNVSVVHHAGRLLSLGEIGLPYRISPDDLSTVGVVDYDGRTNGNMTAHPKIEKATGNMHAFGYGFTPPYLQYRVIDTEGTLVHQEPIAVRRSTMMHDFAITDRDVVFWEMPVLFDLDDAIKMVSDPASGALPFHWEPSYGARIGVMPLGGPASRIRWVEIDPCYVYHGVNAHRSGDDVVLDVCRLDSTFASPTEPSSQSLRRWTIDTSGAQLTFRDERLDCPPADLPMIDRRLTGTTQRHAWLVPSRHVSGTIDFGGVVHVDYRTGTVTTWDPGAGRTAGEWLFVPGGDAEGDGWVMTYVYDRATDRSDLVVLDALDVAKGPVARVRLPARVPLGFHATWVRTA